MPTTATFSPGDRVLYRFRECAVTTVQGEQLGLRLIDGYNIVQQTHEVYPLDAAGSRISGRYLATRRLLLHPTSRLLAVDAVDAWLLQHWQDSMTCRQSPHVVKRRLEELDAFRNSVESTLADVRSIEVHGCRLFGG